MPSLSFSLRYRPSMFFASLLGMLVVLLVAGGASFGNASGQAIVRGVGWAAVAFAVLTLPHFGHLRHPLLLLLLAIATVLLLQLIPLPPFIWQALPGRRLLVDAASISGQEQPWRPWSIVPGATMNALGSLIVPLAIFLLGSGLRPRERRWLPAIILLLIVISTMIGLVQFSGNAFDNPFVNETAGDVSGPFANRNHFALMLAMGCLLAPFWAFSDDRQARLRAPAALGMVLLFLLMILATGSRAGLGLGVIALMLGMLTSAHGMQRMLARFPRWVFPVMLAAIIAMVAIFLTLSVFADRAISINRLFAVDAGQDMRTRGLPAVWGMIVSYFPFGAGFGGFDPMFRLHEPFGLLKPTFFNHAHNDFLEVVLDGGIAGLLLLLAGMVWWARRSVRAWHARARTDRRFALPRLGSAMIFLVIVASIFDYPARTPLVMALMIIAGLWLRADLDAPEVVDADRNGSRRGNSPARLAVRSVAALVVAATAYIGVTHSMALAKADKDPALAHRLAPADGRITAALAHQSFAANPVPTADSAAAGLARLALLQDPTAVQAVAVLGLQAQLRGDTPSARRLFSYAETLTRRDAQTQLWAIEDAVARDDIPAALRHYDIALRTSKSAPELLFPVLASALTQSDVGRHLAQTLAQQPIWTKPFIGYLTITDENWAAKASLFVKLRSKGVTIPDEAVAATVNGLVVSNAFDEAWRFYAVMHPEARRTASRDPQFTADLTAPSLFDWTPVTDTTFTTSIQRAEDAGLFDFSAAPSAGGIVLRQLQLLPPGRYRLEGRSSNIEQPATSRPFWSLTCASDRELGRIDVPNSTGASSAFTGQFVVPPNCVTQMLALTVKPSDAIAGVSGQINSVRLYRLD